MLLKTQHKISEDTTRDLHDSHVAAEAATAVEQTLSSVEEAAFIAKQTAGQVPKSAPRTTRGAVKAVKRIKKSKKPTTVRAKARLLLLLLKPKRSFLFILSNMCSEKILVIHFQLQRQIKGTKRIDVQLIINTYIWQISEIL
jgi:secreted Zn-dependent insulinase-like peptidase